MSPSGPPNGDLVKLNDFCAPLLCYLTDNVLLMSFTQIDPSDPGKVYSLIIDMSQPDGGYAVPNCDPPLPTIHELVKRLNEDKQFYAFVKRGKSRVEQ